MVNKMISIAEDFTDTPAGRYLTDGPFSGQLFREELLLPAIRDNEHVAVDLEGTLGFGSSFLEEAFGGLVRAGQSAATLHKKLTILSSIEIYKSRIWKYIDDADLASR